MSIELKGSVVLASTGYYIVKSSSKNGAYIYVPNNVTAYFLEIGDEVIVKAVEMKNQIATYQTSYQATLLVRNNIAESVIHEEASITNVYPDKALSIKYGAEAVYCPVETHYHNVQINDIVQFQAEKWSPKKPHLLKEKLHYKCISLSFVKKPEIINASGKLINVSNDAQTGIVEGTLENNKKVKIHINTKNIKPTITNLESLLTKHTILNIKAIEQVATPEEYEILPNNTIRLYVYKEEDMPVNKNEKLSRANCSYDKSADSSDEEPKEKTTKPFTNPQKTSKANCSYDKSFDSSDGVNIEKPSASLQGVDSFNGVVDEKTPKPSSNHSCDKRVQSSRFDSLERCLVTTSIAPSRAESSKETKKSSRTLLEELTKHLDRIRMEPPIPGLHSIKLEDQWKRYAVIAHLREPNCTFCLDSLED